MKRRWEWCLSTNFSEHESQTEGQSPVTPNGYMHLLPIPGVETTPLKLCPTSNLSFRASSTSSPVTGWVRWRGSRRPPPRCTGCRGGGAARESHRRTRSARERRGARKGRGCTPQAASYNQVPLSQLSLTLKFALDVRF